jgi:hypothetical protein
LQNFMTQQQQEIITRQKCVNDAVGQLSSEGDRLSKQISALEPQLGAIRGILKDEQAQQIFAKLQQDFSRIKTFEVRAEYIFDKESREEVRVLPFDYVWFRKNGEGRIQMYSVNELTTTLTSENNFSVIKKYHMFMPFEMTWEGREIADLKGLNDLQLEFNYRPEILGDLKEEEREDAFKKLVTNYNACVGRLQKIHVQVIINNYSAFDYILSKDDGPWPMVDVNSDLYGSSFTKVVSKDISRDFTDPLTTYGKVFTLYALAGRQNASQGTYCENIGSG